MHRLQVGMGVGVGVGKGEGGRGRGGKALDYVVRYHPFNQLGRR